MAYTFASGIELTFTNDIAVIHMRNGENRIDKTFVDAFNNALDTVESNVQCRALITTGEGKFYSNGLVFDYLLKTDDESIRKRKGFPQLLLRIMTFPLVTIAAINGHAFAGGGLLALHHDFRVMQSSRGWLCLNEIHLKLPLGLNHATLRAKCSPNARRDLALGKRFTAQEGKNYGIVDVVTSPDALVSSATDLANQLTRKQKYDRQMLKSFKEDLYRDVVDVFNSALNSKL